MPDPFGEGLFPLKRGAEGSARRRNARKRKASSGRMAPTGGMTASGLTTRPRDPLPALEGDFGWLSAIPGLGEPAGQASIQNRLSRLLEVSGDPELPFHPIESADRALDLQPARAGSPLLDPHRTSAEAATFVVQRHREHGSPFEDPATR